MNVNSINPGFSAETFLTAVCPPPSAYFFL